jgi:uncharacterized membrane protein YjjP (DUF1212 family)
MFTPTTFTCAFWQDDDLDQFVHIERVEPAEYNLGRLWEIDRLVETIADGKLGIVEGLEELRRLAGLPPHYSTLGNALSWALCGGSFAALLSPNPLDCAAATLLSLVLYLITRLSATSAGWKPVLTIIAPFASGALASMIALAGVGINAPFVILSSIIIFIPGLALTVALTEISVGHLISGSSRLVDAVMSLLKLFFGAISGLAVVEFLWFGPASAAWLAGSLPDWRAWPAIFGLSLGLGIAFNIPLRKMPWGLLAAGIAYGSASLGGIWFGMHAGMFIGALAVGIYSNLFSRITRGPGSILMIHGIILLVPGSRTYMILNHWFSGENILPGGNSANQALMAFVALIAGLLIANALLPSRKSL